jgi:hypothetical protein
VGAFFVPYQITFSPTNPTVAVQGKTVVRETAVEAWALVQHIFEGLEGPAITDPSGERIGWRELRARATKEAK